MNYAQTLAAALSSKSPPPMGGAAGQAQQALSGRAYQLHVQEAQANGRPPLTPEQFAAQK
jgi:hypothetical protein